MAIVIAHVTIGQDLAFLITSLCVTA